MGVRGVLASVMLAASCLATAAAAAETYTVYKCAFVLPGRGGKESKLLIAIDAANKAFTYDTKPGSDQPVRLPVSVRKAGPDDLIYSYAVDIPNADGKTGRFDIQARIPRAGGSSRVSMQGRGYTTGPRGTGNCTLERNVRLPY